MEMEHSAGMAAVYSQALWRQDEMRQDPGGFARAESMESATWGEKHAHLMAIM